MPPTGPAGMSLADGGKRIVALLLDGILLGIVVSMPLTLIFGSVASVGGTSFDAGQVFASAIGTIIYFLYYALMIGLLGQTVGGMVMKVRVVDQNGGPATTEHGFKRSAWVLLSLIPCLGFVLSLGLVIWGLVNLFNDPLRQTPWDKFGGTVVVDA